MAAELKFLIDGLDRGQPLNPEDFGITINEDDSIGARIVSYDADLIFGGDVFTYLYTKLATSGYCELVRVNVQYLCTSGTWLELINGYIIATEAAFVLDRCEVKTKVYDESFSTKINNNKAIPFSMDLTLSKNGALITPPTKYQLWVFTPQPTVSFYPPAFGYTVYDVFKHLIACMSDGLIDFDSNYFAANYPQNEVLFYTSGESIRIKQDVEVLASFETLYNALRLKLNLGLGIEKQSNGRPLLRIEQASYFQQSTPSVNLYDQPDIEMKFDTKRLYQAAQFGNDLVLEAGQCDNGDTPCEFVQTPFRGFRDEKFGFIGECNTSNILQLKTSDIIFDTNVIQDIVVFNNTGYDTNGVVIMANWDGFYGAFTARAKIYDPYGIGNAIYNGNFTNEFVSANWLSGFPNSLESFLQPFNPTTTVFLARATVDTQCWTVDDDQFYSYAAATATFLNYPNEITDAGNNFSGSTYVVPFTGIYTFNAKIQLDGLSLVTGNKIGFASIKHYDAADADIQTIDGPQITSPAINFSELTVTATIVCNAGDLVRTDASVKIVTPGPSATQCVLFQWTDIPSGTVYRTEFSGSGLPLTPTTLEPVDINDVQTYLYKFNRPLTMAEINAITSETSKPILLGRKDDVLAVSPTYIKAINIESVMRKNAQFELRSNKLLP
jgi:hypothetical protein